MKNLIIITLLAIFACSNAHAQSLAVDTNLTEVYMPDSVNYNDNLSHTVVVNIAGSTPYTGIVWLLAGVDSSAGMISVDTIGFRNVNQKINDSINFQINETYNNANAYRTGGNVVVIWPVAPALNTADTFRTNVHVKKVVGINENEALYKAFNIYPNPSSNYIYINKTAPEEKVKRVRLFSPRGKLIYNEKLTSKINISSFSKGIYLFDIELEGGELLHYKIIKTE